jgi:endonuclease/exonuclease/phosphatase (EEP) superfamily protein YafD
MVAEEQSGRAEQPAVQGFFELKLRPWGLVTSAGALLCCATVTGFLGRLWWLFDLTSHFRVQYAVLLAGVALLVLLPRKSRLSLVFAGFSLVNAATVMPLYVGRGHATMDGARTLRVMLLNVNSANTNYDSVKEAIRRYAPDLFVLEEVDSTWLDRLRDLSDDYPYSEAEPRSDNFGMALFSRYPLRHAGIVQIGDADVPSVCAQLGVHGNWLTVLGTHPLPPGGAEYSRLRNDQLAALPRYLADAGGMAVVLGDLNVTPWSPYFRELLRQAGLRDSSRGWGLQPTWPTFALPLRIPIDHVLHGPDLRVIHREIGPDVGSDHFPVIVDFLVSGRERH